MPMQWQGTGYQQEIPGQIDKIPPFDPRTGDHLWLIITSYRWAPGTEQPMLDSENLVSLVGPGCYHCEKPYTEQLAKRRCRGHG